MIHRSRGTTTSYSFCYSSNVNVYNSDKYLFEVSKICWFQSFWKFLFLININWQLLLLFARILRRILIGSLIASSFYDGKDSKSERKWRAIRQVIESCLSDCRLKLVHSYATLYKKYIVNNIIMWRIIWTGIQRWSDRGKDVGNLRYSR